MSISVEKITRLRADMLSVPLSTSNLVGEKTPLSGEKEQACYCGAGALLKLSGLDVEEIKNVDAKGYLLTAQRITLHEEAVAKAYGIWPNEDAWRRAMTAFDDAAFKAYETYHTRQSHEWPSGRELTPPEAEAAVDAFLKVMADEAVEVAL